MQTTEQRTGELFLLVTIVIEGLYPVLVNEGVRAFSPILFAALSSFLAAFGLFWYLLIRKALWIDYSLRLFGYVLGVVLFIVVLSQVLIFIGAQYTSGINIGLLIRFELVSTFVIGVLILRERIERMQLWGALLILIGTFLILFNGSLTLNSGDLLIVLATWCFPFGNYCAKKALHEMRPTLLLFWRYLIGGIILLALALMFEGNQMYIAEDPMDWGLLILFSALVLMLSKTCFYEGLRRLTMTSIIFLVVAGASVLTLVFAYIFLGEVPSLYQWSGFVVSLFGMYWMVGRRRPVETATDPV